MTLFDVFSGQNTGEQQSTGATSEPTGDTNPIEQPQATGGQAQQAETPERSQTQPSTDTTPPAQSTPATPQSSGMATPSENNAMEVSRRFRRKLLKRKICLTVKRL